MLASIEIFEIFKNAVVLSVEKYRVISPKRKNWLKSSSNKSVIPEHKWQTMLPL